MKKLSMDELGRPDIVTFKAQEKHNVVLILDSIRSMNNVGSAFRTSDAFGIEKLFLCGITATPPHRDIQKTAIGATESVDWEHRKDISELLKELKSKGYKIYALEQTDESISLQSVKCNSEEKVAFVFGNEVFGVSDQALDLVDQAVEIPQFGTKHSLNVTVSIGVTLWHYINQIVM